MKRFYLVEGNIGSGKSTLVSHLGLLGSSSSTSSSTKYRVVPEPTDVWTRPRPEACGRSLLELFYADTPKYAFAFQSHVLTTRWEQYAALDPADARPIVSERSLTSSFEVFGGGLRDDGCMDAVAFSVYESIYRAFQDMLEQRFSGYEVVVLYVKTDPETCLERIRRRGRQEERGLTLDYLRAVHARHEGMMEAFDSRGIVVRAIDGNADEGAVLRQAEIAMS
jgi:deoxyadenosine/deoxycytidine kinase